MWKKNKWMKGTLGFIIFAEIAVIAYAALRKPTQLPEQPRSFATIYYYIQEAESILRATPGVSQIRTGLHDCYYGQVVCTFYDFTYSPQSNTTSRVVVSVDEYLTSIEAERGLKRKLKASVYQPIGGGSWVNATTNFGTFCHWLNSNNDRLHSVGFLRGSCTISIISAGDVDITPLARRFDEMAMKRK